MIIRWINSAGLAQHSALTHAHQWTIVHRRHAESLHTETGVQYPNSRTGSVEDASKTVVLSLNGGRTSSMNDDDLVGSRLTVVRAGIRRAFSRNARGRQCSWPTHERQVQSKKNEWTEKTEKTFGDADAPSPSLERTIYRIYKQLCVS